MNYIVYTFQFTPLIDAKQLDLFEPTLQIREELIVHKLEYLEQALGEAKYNNRERQYVNSIQIHRDNVMVMRLANRKSVVREKAFRIIKDEDEPSCGIIIDYRNEHQIIAIEDAKRAFNCTDTVRNILEHSLNQILEKFRLRIRIKKQILPSEFWDYVNQYRGCITEVHFKYQYPNLGRANEAMKEMLADAGKTINSTESEVSFKGESLEIEENNEVIKGFATDASKSGIPVRMKIKGINGFVKTGDKTRQIEIEELDFEGDALAFSKLLETLDSCV